MDTTYKNPNENFFTQNITAPISTSTLTSNEQPINVPPTPTLPTPENLGNFDIKSILSELQKPSDTQNTQDSAISKAGSLYQRLFGKSTDKQAMELQAGIPEKNKLLTEAVNRFRTTTAEQNQLLQEQGAIPLALQEQVQGRGVTAGGLAPIQAGELRKNAIKQYQVTSRGLFQQAEIANLRDDIAGAQASIDKAIEYKYAPIEQEINYYKDFVLPTLKDRVTGERADKLKALEIQINERTRLLNEGREDSKVGSELALTAMKLFPNDKQAQYNAQLAMQEAQKEQPDINKIVGLVGRYQVDPMATQTAIEELKNKRLQNAKLQAEADKIKADISKTQAEKEKILAETTTNTVNAKQQLQNNEALTLAKELRGEAKGKAGAVGFGLQKLVPFGQSLGLQGARTGFEAKVNTLKSNLTLDNLKLLKGAMSDKDLLFLNSIGSSLDTNMSEEQFNNELDRVIKKLEDAGATSGVVSQTINVQGQNYTVGQTYQDASGKKWIVDAQGNWSEQ